MILYGIGLLIDVERLEKIVERWGHVLRIKKEDIHRVDAWFDKYGMWTVLFCRMVPLVRSLISIPAGMSNMKFGLFLLFTTIGTLIWNVILVCVGAALGASWESILHFMDVYSIVVYVMLAIIVIGCIIWWIRRSKKKK
ncbi:hypothetical protein D3C74_362570 [compost metagenome]